MLKQLQQSFYSTRKKYIFLESFLWWFLGKKKNLFLLLPLTTFVLSPWVGFVPSSFSIFMQLIFIEHLLCMRPPARCVLAARH